MHQVLQNCVEDPSLVHSASSIIIILGYVDANHAIILWLLVNTLDMVVDALDSLAIYLCCTTM